MCILFIYLSTWFFDDFVNRILLEELHYNFYVKKKKKTEREMYNNNNYKIIQSFGSLPPFVFDIKKSIYLNIGINEGIIKLKCFLYMYFLFQKKNHT